MSEKLHKVLARVGLGSRRHMEQVISEGRVSINGQVAKLGDRVASTDELRIDGRKVQFQIEREMRRRVVIYYKPEGEICSRNDPEGRPTVFDHLPQISQDRWVMVGRLDINSTGLLMFTNDGELANRLMHPSREVEREYAVRVMGEVTQEMKNTLLAGVQLDDGPAKFESLIDAGGEGFNRWYQVVVKEGRNREVRRLFESQGLKVSRLLRTRYGIIHLPRELRTGRWLELDRMAIDQLAKSVDLRPREQTGVQSVDVQRRQAKMMENPLRARTQPRQTRAARDQREQQRERKREQAQGKRFERDDHQQQPRENQRFGERSQRSDNRFNDRNERSDNRNRFGDKPRFERSDRNDNRHEQRENRYNNRHDSSQKPRFGERPQRNENRFNDRNERSDNRNRFGDKPRFERNDRNDNRHEHRENRNDSRQPRENQRFGDRPQRSENRFNDRSDNRNRFEERKPRFQDKAKKGEGRIWQDEQRHEHPRSDNRFKRDE
ncbi:23S rRNA pseudouridine(2605) synthase RluB [Acinetobacter sp. c1-l78]|uniref:23S rRNA pseudouridine(2605) synthase RluB n=1 Tax=Acinetobacter sp. c1-l78 TaxID=3342803 RepID=UPI0035B73F77